MLNGKNLLSLIMIALCTIFLCGCASVDYSRIVYPDGKITDRIVVEVDSKAMQYSTLSAPDLYNRIKVDLDNMYIQPIEDYIASAVSGDQYSFEDKQILLNNIKPNVEIIQNKVICDVNFESVEAFELLYSNDDDASTDTQYPKLKSGTFVNKYIQSSSKNAFTVLKEESLKSIINKYKGYFGNNYGLEDVTLTQVFASPNIEIRSNADDVAIENIDGNKIKMHQWEIKSNNLDYELEFYTLSANPIGWYILAFAITMAVTIMVALMILKKKLSKNVDSTLCNTTIDENNNKVE